MKKQLIWLAALVCWWAVAAAHAEEHVSVVLSNSESQSPENSAEVVVKIINAGDKPVFVLKYMTPDWDSGLIAGDLFTITTEAGSRVNFIGDYVDPGPLTDDMFYTIAPGQSKSTTVNLRNYYQVEGGSYRVVFNLNLGERPGGKQLKQVGKILVRESDLYPARTVASNALVIKVAPELAKSNSN